MADNSFELSCRRDENFLHGLRTRKYGGKIDEIVVKDEDIKHFHLEYMDKNHIWLKINNVVFNLTARGEITTTMEDEKDG